MTKTTKEPEIAAIFFRGENGGFRRVGEGGITKIIPSQKSGEMSYIPWVKLYKGEQLYQEFCQNALEGIEYKIQGDPDAQPL